MQKIILFLFVFTALVTQAQTVVTSEIQKDSYLPRQGTLLILPALTYSGSKQSIKGPTATVADYKNTTTSFDYIVAYGITDSFTLGLLGHFIISDKSEYSYGAGSTLNGTSETLKSSGIQDPEILAKYRIKDNEDTKMRINLVGGISPKLQKAKYATANSDGNEATGATNLRVGLEFYKEIGNLEFQFLLQRYFYGKQELESAANSSASTERSQTQSSVFGGGLMVNISDHLGLGGNIKLNLVDSRDVDTLTNGAVTSTTQYDSSSNSALTLVGRLKINEGSAVQLNLQTLLSSSQSAKIGTTKISFDDMSATQAQIALMQEF